MRWNMALAFAAVLAFGGLARADTVFLKDGQVLHGRVTDVIKDKAVITLDGQPGSRVEVPLNQLTDYGLFEVERSQTDLRSPVAREKLGDDANSRGLLSVSLEEYEAAARLYHGNIPQELRSKIHRETEKVGQDRLARAERLVSDGRLIEARSLLAECVDLVPDSAAAKAAQRRLKDLDRQIEEGHLKRHQQDRQAMDARRVNDDLKAATDLVAAGDRNRTEGFLLAGSLGRSERHLLDAISEYERARSGLMEMEGSPAARERSGEVASLLDTATHRLIETYVDLGHQYLAKGNIVRATHYMGLALAMDPTNAQALGLREEIGLSSNEGWVRPFHRLHH